LFSHRSLLGRSHASLHPHPRVARTSGRPVRRGPAPRAPSTTSTVTGTRTRKNSRPAPIPRTTPTTRASWAP